eukprot:COSAG01_NODE_1032_length_12010_cov_10.208494_3_plen_76_part_00
MEASQRRGGHAPGVGQDDDAAARLARYHLRNISMLITTGVAEIYLRFWIPILILSMATKIMDRLRFTYVSENWYP